MARELLRFSLPALRQAASKRGLPVAQRSTRAQIACLLVRDKLLRDAETLYARGEAGYPARDSAYGTVCDAIGTRGKGAILDIGCGPGLFAEELLRSRVLSPAGAYLGIDPVRGAVELARARLSGDPRFRFEVGDAEAPPADGPVDCVLLLFVLSYMDTHAADRVLRALQRKFAGAILVVALTLRSAFDRKLGAGDDAGDADELRLYLAGHLAGRAPAVWDPTRFECYRRCFDACYRLEAEETLPGPEPQVLWIGQPRTELPRATR